MMWSACALLSTRTLTFLSWHAHWVDHLGSFTWYCQGVLEVLEVHSRFCLRVHVADLTASFSFLWENIQSFGGAGLECKLTCFHPRVHLYISLVDRARINVLGAHTYISEWTDATIP